VSASDDVTIDEVLLAAGFISSPLNIRRLLSESWSLEGGSVGDWFEGRRPSGSSASKFSCGCFGLVWAS